MSFPFVENLGPSNIAWEYHPIVQLWHVFLYLKMSIMQLDFFGRSPIQIDTIQNSDHPNSKESTALDPCSGITVGSQEGPKAPPPFDNRKWRLANVLLIIFVMFVPDIFAYWVLNSTFSIQSWFLSWVYPCWKLMSTSNMSVLLQRKK